MLKWFPKAAVIYKFIKYFLEHGLGRVIYYVLAVCLSIDFGFLRHISEFY
jgi:hypothetical protein